MRIDNRLSSLPAHPGNPPGEKLGVRILASSQLPIHAASTVYTVDGNGTVNSLPAWPRNTRVELSFTGTPTFVNSTKLSVPGAANYTFAAGDKAVCISDGGGNWRVFPEPISGRAPIFAYEGDSLTHNSWPINLKAMSGFFARGTSYDFATPGDTASAMVGEYASQAGAVKIGQGQEAYFFLWAGTNDLINGDSETTVYNNLKSLWAAARTSGYKVVAFTIIRRATFTTGQEASRVALNALILSDASLYDYVVRPDAIFQNTSDTYVYQSDGVHPNGNGMLVVAKLAAGAVLGVRSVPAAPMDALSANGLQLNGNVAVAQEFGTSGAVLAAATNKYTADMWIAVYNNAAAAVASAQAALSDLPGFNFGHQIKANTALSSLANGDYAMHYTTIEGYRIARLAWGTAAARPISVGFWFNSTAAGTSFFRIGNGSNNRFYYHEFTVAAGWNWIQTTVPGDTTGTWDATTGYGASFGIFSAGKSASIAQTDLWGSTAASATTNNTNLLSTNNNQTTITGFIVLPGIELPDVESMPLIHKPYLVSLDECRRYLYTWNAEGVVNNGFMNGSFYTTTVMRGVLHFPKPMRIAPTMTYSALADFAGLFNNNSPGLTPSAMAINVAGKEQAQIDVTFGAAQTIGWGGFIRDASTGVARAHFKAQF